MLRLGNAKAIVIQGLIAPKGLSDSLKALISWEFENKPEKGGMADEKKTLFLRAPLVAIGAQKYTLYLDTLYILPQVRYI